MKTKKNIMEESEPKNVTIIKQDNEKIILNNNKSIHIFYVDENGITNGAICSADIILIAIEEYIIKKYKESTKLFEPKKYDECYQKK